MRKRYVLKNKKRFASIVMLFTLVVVFTGLIVTAGASSQEQGAYDVFVVSHGDTLWEIASTFGEGTDPRAYIYEIKALNQMEGDDIYTGQELFLP